MESDDGVSRSVQARKKAIETQWLARVLETGQVREMQHCSFRCSTNLAHCADSLLAITNPNYLPDGNVLQGGADQAPPRGGINQFHVAQFKLDMRSNIAFYSALQTTSNLSSFVGPKVLLIATSAASRPRAINTRPFRGTLLRASKVCQLPPIKTSNHAAKSMVV